MQCLKFELSVIGQFHLGKLSWTVKLHEEIKHTDTFIKTAIP